MTTATYSFEFENDENFVKVYFIDDMATIDTAESLAQIGHYHRRKWAAGLIEIMTAAGVSSFQYMLEDIKGKCPFERRLKTENWIQPFVILTTADAQQALYVYRLYIFTFYIFIFFDAY